MFILVTGVSGSGKSEYAENLAVRLAGHADAKAGTFNEEHLPDFNRLYYVATMEPYGKEGERRIARHRRLRTGKGFNTIECYTDIKRIVVEKEATVLLECMSNLLANELYREDGLRSAKKPVVEGIVKDIWQIASNCRNLVVVTNDVFGDDGDYEESVREYIQMLGKLNRELAKIADEVVEVVYSVPVKLRSS